MFEASLINYLKTVASVTALVGTYAGEAAIFSYEAPEDCNLSYITCRIESSAEPSKVMEDFVVFVDYYDFNNSRLNCIEAARQLQYALDGKFLAHDHYLNIRFSYFSGSFVESDDPRDISYNLQFSARAVRSGFMATA